MKVGGGARRLPVCFSVSLSLAPATALAPAFKSQAAEVPSQVSPLQRYGCQLLGAFPQACGSSSLTVFSSSLFSSQSW